MTGPDDELRPLLVESLRRLEASDAARHEPLAVLGLGLRLPPDVDDPETFWDLLVQGQDAVGRVLAHPDGHRSPSGGPASGSLLRVDDFDAGFFAISAAEARQMDPQQRMVLQTTWEALEDAGLTASQLRGTPTGVFVGAYANDWLLLRSQDPEGVDAWTGPGTAHSMLANRLSYFLDGSGPSLTVDTACSSSLTALHLACRALRAGDCDTAVVAGVHLALSPFSGLVTGRSLPMSTSGRCRTFDAEADGIVRGEGCVVVVLRRDSDVPDGLSARGRVLGSAINHDGRTNGLTAPDPIAQAALVRRALQDARTDPAVVTYVEAHGTGTSLGDPIETDALREVYGAGTRRCLLGSLKAQTGHLEAAAGLAGLAKALLVLEHRTVPGQLHLDQLNPEVRLDGSRLQIARATEPLPEGPEGPVAAVSSFGFGGANAHVLLGPGDPVTPVDAGAPPALLLVLSAASEESRHEHRGAYRELLDGADDVMSAQVCRAAAHRREHLPVRAAWVAPDAAGLRAALADEPGRTVGPPGEPGEAGEPVLVLSGQGSQWAGMGRGLLGRPELAGHLDRWEHEVDRAAGWSLRDRLLDPGDDLQDTEHAQVAVAAVQLAVVELLTGWGVRPRAVLGHSMGEVVAACVAGVLTSAEAFDLLVARARVIASAGAEGAMLAVDLPEPAARALVKEVPLVDVAAVNAPGSVVLAGAFDAVADLEQQLRDRAVRVRRLPVSHAFHSPLLDGCGAVLERRLGGRPAGRAPRLPMWSTVTGDRLTGPPDPRHWGLGVRGTVRFADALSGAVAATGARTVVEVGPHPVLLQAAESVLAEADGPSAPRPRVRVLPSLRRGEDPTLGLNRLAAALHVGGAQLDWSAVLPAPQGRVALPRYPWRRTRHWPATPPPEGSAVGQAAIGTPAKGPAPSGPAPVGPPALDVDGVCDLLRRRVAAALEVTVDEVGPEVPLREWELESLTVVDIRAAVERGLDAPVPLGLLLSGDSPRALAEALVAGRADRPEPGRASEGADDLLARIDSLSDDEIEAALAALNPEEERG